MTPIKDSAASKALPDWERIELDYRSGMLSTREIAADAGISHTAINKRAKAHGWERDLSARIRAKAESLVSRQMVSAEVSMQRLATERQVIEAGAERIAQVRGEHRADSYRVRNLGLNLLAELEGQSVDPGLLDQLGEMLRAADDNGVDRMNDLYRKIISTPSRIDSAKKVAETLKHAIAMEREAYGLDDKTKGLAAPGSLTITI